MERLQIWLLTIVIILGVAGYVNISQNQVLFSTTCEGGPHSVNEPYVFASASDYYNRRVPSGYSSCASAADAGAFDSLIASSSLDLLARKKCGEILNSKYKCSSPCVRSPTDLTSLCEVVDRQITCVSPSSWAGWCQVTVEVTADADGEYSCTKISPSISGPNEDSDSLKSIQRILSFTKR